MSPRRTMAIVARVNLISGETKHSAGVPSFLSHYSGNVELRCIPKWASPSIHVFDPMLLGNIGVMTPDICSPRAGSGACAHACLRREDGSHFDAPRSVLSVCPSVWPRGRNSFPFSPEREASLFAALLNRRPLSDRSGDRFSAGRKDGRSMIYARRGTQHHRRRPLRLGKEEKKVDRFARLPARPREHKKIQSSLAIQLNLAHARTSDGSLLFLPHRSTEEMRTSFPPTEHKQQQHLSAPLIRVSPHLCIGGSVRDFTLNEAVPTESYFGDNDHIMQCEKLFRKRMGSHWKSFYS